MRVLGSGTRKAQAAVDFMMSYGIALIIIIIAVALVYRVGLLNPNIVQPACSAVPSFSCSQFFINTNGTLTLKLYQSTGGTITIDGIGCASEVSGTGDRPAFGNVYVTGNSVYYPNLPSGVGSSIYSGSGTQINVTCYSSSGVARNNLGAGFFGYVWLNYSQAGVGPVTQVVASVTARYT